MAGSLRGRALAGTLVGILAGVGLAGLANPVTARAETDEAVAFQVNPAHDGNQPGDRLTAPLAQKWTRDLGGPVSYPLIAGGKVFVTVGNLPQAGGPNYGSSLYALDQLSGATSWGPIKLGGNTYWSAATYENGRVFVIDGAGVLRAINVATGDPLWTIALGDNRSVFDSAPTAFRGMVYVGGGGSATQTDPGGTVWAVRESDGAIAWSTRVQNGMTSSPAAMATGLFVDYGCPSVYRLDPLNGTQQWHYAPASCHAGPGRTPVYFNSIVYARDRLGNNTLVNAEGGFSHGPFTAGPPPAFDQATVFAVDTGGSTMQAKDTVVGGATRWTFAGDGQLSSAPVVANGTVYVGSSAGNLYAVDETTGAPTWTTNVGAPIARSDFEPTPNGPLTGLAVGQGLLVVPASQKLVAYTSATAQPAGGLASTFYFAEGFTAPGFHEVLSLLMPNKTGTAQVDYYTRTGHTVGSVPMTAGHVSTLDVNQAIGPNQEVSIKVTLPHRGVVERALHFTYGPWHGSTDKTGVNAPNTEWDFAEGSTLPMFNEYLTLQNPNSLAVPVDLHYMTEDPAVHPTKSLVLPANSRTTVPVFVGNRSPNPSCDAATTCGLGRDLTGVSVQVLAHGQPIVAERPFYLNAFDFGSGVIRDGHVEFGANAAQGQWQFAEGTTLPGFKEFLTLQNPGTAEAPNVQLDYHDESGKMTFKSVRVPAQSRVTIPVFDSGLGVGPGVTGVSLHIVSDVPIVAERPMYVYHDFGSGPVAGATVSHGSSLQSAIAFSGLSTQINENDYLTILSYGKQPIRIDYYLDSGLISRLIYPQTTQRTTIAVFDPQDAGRGQRTLGVVVETEGGLVVEKVTYSTNAASYGATDATGYSPPWALPGSFQ